MKLVNWNVEWATPKSTRNAEVLRRIGEHAPDIVCLTETHNGLLSRHGHSICSQADYGYKTTEYRRKVMLWSREPWEQVSDVGLEALPPGRFVSGVTQTPLGAVTVVGVCIPWFGSRIETRRGPERKRRWEDHEEYLTGLTEVLKGYAAKRLIVMGDFNQIVGEGCRAPRELQLKLQEAFPSSMTIATAGLAFEGRGSIDHIVLSSDLAAKPPEVINNVHDNTRLSDHFGVVADVFARRAR